MIYLDDDAAWEYAKSLGINLYDPSGFEGVQSQVESLKESRNCEIHQEASHYLFSVFKHPSFGFDNGDAVRISEKLLEHAHEDAACGQDLIEITKCPSFSVRIFFGSWMIEQYSGAWAFALQHPNNDFTFTTDSLLDGFDMALKLNQVLEVA
jgi:hypothetical protein